MIVSTQFHILQCHACSPGEDDSDLSWKTKRPLASHCHTIDLDIDWKDSRGRFEHPVL